MRRNSIAAVAPILVAAAVIAGCGSSSSSSSAGGSSAAASAPASTPASTAASSAAGNPYGSTPTTSSAAASTSAPAGSAVLVSTKSSKLGTVLDGGQKHLTVYMFEADKPGTSACSGACASVWPPVTGTASVSGHAAKGDLGTITRSDGTKQVTYKGHPLYYYAKDGDSGDAYGQGIKSFGASWYVLAPSGNKIDNS